LPLYKVVGILSALSPRNKWERNKQDLISVIEHKDQAIVATFNGNKNKAITILNSNDKNQVIKILNGKKTVSFFHNIYDPNCQENVTIDGWAFKSLGLHPKNSNYIVAKESYKDASMLLGINPNVLQAIIWIYIREKSLKVT